ncbi:MAG: 4Fe-4S binding protein, partial [Desulfobacteraceae bacterium]|nr:4Fe-4S binding protein [Desulfobacteraceae bacterium]
MEADSILITIGQIPLLDYLNGIVETENGMVLVNEGLKVNVRGDGRAKIFAGGDLIDMPHNAVYAVASGKRAAIAMDCDRKDKDVAEVLKKIVIGDGPVISFAKYMGWDSVNPVPYNNHLVVDSEKIVYDYFNKALRVQKEIQDPDVRIASFKAFTITFNREEAQQEAARCMHCGRCTECDNCLIFCPDMSVLYKGNDQFGYTFDYDYCKGCGICFTECPLNAISMVDEETPVDIEN